MKKVFSCFLVLVIMAAATTGFAKQVDYREYSQWPVSEEKIPFDLYLFRSDAYGCDAKDMYFWNYFNEGRNSKRSIRIHFWRNSFHRFSSAEPFGER